MSCSLLRSISIGIIEALSCLASVFTQKIFPTLISYLSFHGTFYAYAMVAFILTGWAVVTIKHTDGLSLVETERLYDNKTEAEGKYEALCDSKKNDSK